MSSPTAAIDLGTNTARLIIGYGESPTIFRPLLVKRAITRLGGGFTREKGISPEAYERSLVALRDFADEIKKFGVSTVRAVATSAVRDAVNGPSFCADILRETGINLEVIDCKDEGLITLRGVLAGIDDRDGNLLVFDVGGGSTEYTLTVGNNPVFTRSLPLGVVRLTEGKKSYIAMEDKICRELLALKSDLDSVMLKEGKGIFTLVGTAGTATTLAAISLKLKNYDYRLVNNHTLSRAEIENILATLLPMIPAERLQVVGLEQGREDLIIAGILITLKTMEFFGFTDLKVSDFGLLEGLLLTS
jgi:exopolyphosphatase / guanosine-5'-triphosphate,3'-diphosphate pyrophosphatase